MKTLKDKLTASVRQARAAAPQPAAAAAARKALPQRAAKGVPTPAAHQAAAHKANAPRVTASALLPTSPTAPLPASRAEAPPGFAHPDQVWPD